MAEEKLPVLTRERWESDTWETFALWTCPICGYPLDGSGFGDCQHYSEDLDAHFAKQPKLYNVTELTD